MLILFKIILFLFYFYMHKLNTNVTIVSAVLFVIYSFVTIIGYTIDNIFSTFQFFCYELFLICKSQICDAMLRKKGVVCPVLFLFCILLQLSFIIFFSFFIISPMYIPLKFKKSNLYCVYVYPN